MPSSRRELILARIAAALVAAQPGGVLASSVFRSRETSITRAQTPAITVLFAGETVTRMAADTDKHLLRANLAIFVRGDPWDSLADAVFVPMHQAVMTDTALQALVLDVRLTSADPESEEADRTAGALSCMYDIHFITRAGDIAAAPI